MQRFLEFLKALGLLTAGIATGIGVGVGIYALLKFIGVDALVGAAAGGGLGLLAGATALMYLPFWLLPDQVAMTGKMHEAELRCAVIFGFVAGAVGWAAGQLFGAILVGGPFIAVGWYVGRDVKRRLQLLLATRQSTEEAASRST